MSKIDKNELLQLEAKGEIKKIYEILKGKRVKSNSKTGIVCGHDDSSIGMILPDDSGWDMAADEDFWVNEEHKSPTVCYWYITLKKFTILDND